MFLFMLKGLLIVKIKLFIKILLELENLIVGKLFLVM